MSTKQKTGPREKNHSKRATTTKGARGRTRKYRHGKGKSVIKSNRKKR